MFFQKIIALCSENKQLPDSGKAVKFARQANNQSLNIPISVFGLNDFHLILLYKVAARICTAIILYF